jgi:hypothetical protein
MIPCMDWAQVYGPGMLMNLSSTKGHSRQDGFGSIVTMRTPHMHHSEVTKIRFGRENHLMMLDHYRQTKNMLISYDKNKLGFF